MRVRTHTHTHTHTQNGCNRTPPTQPAPVNLALDSTPLETSHSQVTHLSLTPSVQISSYSCQEFIQIRLEGMSSLQGSPFQIVGLPANPSFLKGRGNLSHAVFLPKISDLLLIKIYNQANPETVSKQRTWDPSTLPCHGQRRQGTH